MPLQSTSGAASYDAFGGGAPAVAPNYIEEVFSTYFVTGTGAAPAVNNGIDLSTKGGLVWTKKRTAGYNDLFDTARGANLRLSSNDTAAQDSVNLSFTTTGFSNYTFDNAVNYVTWTFRKQPKFFDVVTYTGTGSNTTIAHNLGSVPACIMVKRTDTTGAWQFYHRSLANTEYLVLNTTAAKATGATRWNSTTPTSTVFSLGTDATVNASGGTYVAYLFAHDAGGFGLTGTDNVISCGSYTGNGSATGPVVTLGYEPQWLLIKNASYGSANWMLFDTMRGLPVGSNPSWLYPNTFGAEVTDSWGRISPLATGFQVATTDAWLNQSGDNHIYIAIRRGPMKVPTSGTSVFYPQAISQADNIDSTGVPFPPDLVNTFSRNGTGRASTDLFQFVDRLRGLGTPNNTFTASAPRLVSSDTSAENTGSSYVQLKADSQNITRGTGWNSATYGNWIDYFWRRAPSFMDVVCYTGNGSTQNITHNLGVAPELMIVKMRSATSATGWIVYAAPLASAATSFLVLNLTDAVGTGNSVLWNSTAPTSTVFSLGASSNINTNGATNVAYLFATCAGVSKVGSYTGTATTKQIDCGFTGGARFVLIKRTDSTGDWYVWDTARGIVSGNDPYLLLNSIAAEVTNTDYIDTYSAGFEISSTAPAAINASGGTFIFLAIA